MRHPLPPSSSWPHRLKLKLKLFRQHRVMLCCNSHSVFRFSRCQWHPDGMNVARIYRTDIESDMAVKTAVAVCETWSSYNTSLYTTGLPYEHRHGVVQFSNISNMPKEATLPPVAEKCSVEQPQEPLALWNDLRLAEAAIKSIRVWLVILLASLECPQWKPDQPFII